MTDKVTMTPEPAIAPPKRRLLRALLVNIAAATAGLGALLGVTIGDRFSLLAPIVYAVPPVLSSLTLLALTLLQAKQGRRRRAIASLLLCGCATFTSYGEHYRASRADSASPASVLSGSSTRLVLWNLSDAFLGIETVVAGVETLDADIAVLLESPEIGESLQSFAAHFPDHVVLPFGDDGCLVLRESPGDSLRHRMPEGSELTSFEVIVDGEWARLFIAELPVHPFFDRGPVLDQIAKHVHEFAEYPRLVVGSFNIPRSSQRLRAAWRDQELSLLEAYVSRGSGVGGSYPSFFPVFDGDHVWVGEGLRCLEARGDWSWRSDHRPWLVDLIGR